MRIDLVGGARDGEVIDVKCPYDDIRFHVIRPVKVMSVPLLIEEPKYIVYSPVLDRTTHEYLYHKLT